MRLAPLLGALATASACHACDSVQDAGTYEQLRVRGTYSWESGMAIVGAEVMVIEIVCDAACGTAYANVHEETRATTFTDDGGEYALEWTGYCPTGPGPQSAGEYEIRERLPNAGWVVSCMGDLPANHDEQAGQLYVQAVSCEPAWQERDCVARSILEAGDAVNRIVAKGN